MKKIVYELDSNGIYARDIILEPIDFSENNSPVYEFPLYYTETKFPTDVEGRQLPFYRAKWTGTEWIEDMPQAEIDALNNQPRKPGVEERLAIAEDTINFLLGL